MLRTNATHGSFIAKSLTKDARAQGKKDSRLTVLVATERDPTGIPIPGDLHLTVTTMKGVEVNAFKRGRSGNNLELVNVQKAELRGEEINFWEYFGKWADEIMGQDTLLIPSHRMAPGDYQRSPTSTRQYELRELLLDGNDIEYVTLRVNYSVGIHKPPLVSYFDIESRGRVLALAPVAVHGGTMQMRVIQRPSTGTPVTKTNT